MPKDLPIALVVNIDSGSAAGHLDRLEAFRDEVRAQGGVAELHRLSAGSLASSDWLPRPPSLVVVCGGDGTLSLCARRLVGTAHVLGVVPVGTMNVFARRAGISLDPALALEQLASGVDRWVDVGRANDRVFLNSMIFGLYPRLVEMRERWRARHAHWPTGLRWLVDTGRAALWTLWHWRRSRFALELDGAAMSGRYVTFAVTNNALSMRMEAVDLAGGDLHVYLPRPLTRSETALLVIRSVFTRPSELEPLEVRRVRELVVHVPEGTRYSMDGEPGRVRGAIRLRTDPGALRMRLPAERAGR